MQPISRRILGFGFISTLATIAFPALAAPTPTRKCRFLGQTIIFKGKLYTCIKVKTKGKTILKWDSGRVIPKITPSQYPSSSPSPSLEPAKASEPIVVTKIEIPLASSSDVSVASTKTFNSKNRYGYSTSYIIVRSAEGLLAMNATCTHNGCTVRIEAEGLLCPCHNALFDAKDGSVLRGPAAYALDRLPVREEAGTIYVTD